MSNKDTRLTSRTSNLGFVIDYKAAPSNHNSYTYHPNPGHFFFIQFQPKFAQIGRVLKHNPIVEHKSPYTLVELKIAKRLINRIKLIRCYI